MAHGHVAPPVCSGASRPTAIAATDAASAVRHQASHVRSAASHVRRVTSSSAISARACHLGGSRAGSRPRHADRRGSKVAVEGHGSGLRQPLPVGGQLAELSRAYTIALLTGDEVAAELTHPHALEARLTKAEIDDEIIAPALWYVGELWQRGEITIADEHLATEISLRVLALHREAHRLTAHRRRASVMLAAPSGERHIVALEMVADLLREAGYRVLMLGSTCPRPRSPWPRSVTSRTSSP